MEELSTFIKDCNKIILNSSCEDVNMCRNYILKDRGINKDTIKKQYLGFCNNEVNIPHEIKYFSENKNWNLSKNLNGKIICPIFDEFNNPIAVATRVPEKGFRWWNLPKPFFKGNCLFLLNKAKNEIFKNNKVYVVEGYMDALILHQYGLKNVVAVMGTALTLRKIALIIRYCNNICLCFDSDSNKSGEKAKNKAIFTISKYEMFDNISVVDNLPIGDDPASFVLNYGLEKFLAKEKLLNGKEIEEICKKVHNGNK